MQRGKKTTAQRIAYYAFDIIREQSSLDPLEVFQQAMRNATPLIEVKPKRVGGATYQVPTELRKVRSEALAMRWLIRGARGGSAVFGRCRSRPGAPAPGGSRPGRAPTASMRNPATAPGSRGDG